MNDIGTLMRRCHHRRAGFTLSEIMIAMGVIVVAIVAGLA